MLTHCMHEIREHRIEEFRADDLLGIDGVILHDAISENRCRLCGFADSITIPNVQGLIAAVAISRVMIPFKLCGKDIRFLRAALDVTAQELSSKVEVRADGISRWEHDKEVISSRSEKLLRLYVGEKLHHQTKVKFDVDAVFSMRFQAWRPLERPLLMRFVLKKKEQTDPQWQDAA